MSWKAADSLRFLLSLLVAVFAIRGAPLAGMWPWQPATRYALRGGITEMDASLDRLARADEPGWAVMLLRDGKPILRRFSGVESLESRVPISADTRFYIASVGKTITATAVLVLYERGEIRLDDPLARYVEGLPGWSREVRVLHLLQHTSGIPDYFDALGERVSGMTNADVVTFTRGVGALEFEPGTRFAYSNTGYCLLAEIVESATGKAFEEFIAESILRPLGMHHTAFLRKDTQVFDHRARGYRREGSGFVADDYDLFTVGSGGAFSTLDDVVTWYQAQATSRLLRPATTALLFATPVTLSGRQSYLGMGWSNETFGPRTPDLEGLRSFASIGELKGFRALVQIFPDQSVGYIALSNTGKLPLHGGEIAKMLFRRD